LSGSRRLVSRKGAFGLLFYCQLQIGAVVLTFGVSILPTNPPLPNINHCMKYRRQPLMRLHSLFFWDIIAAHEQLFDISVMGRLSCY
jgi:hypothetical protein